VYHYTDLHGLLGILNTKELWATDLAYMNDSSEEAYSAGVVATAVNSSRFAHLSDKLRATLRDLAQSLYALCFCEDGDLLSQWRAYASRGAGYALQFRLDQLAELRAEGGTITSKVLYTPHQQQEVVNCILDKTIGTMAEISPTFDPSKLERPETLHTWIKKGTTCTVALAIIQPFIKNPAFFQEQEWRTVVAQPANGEAFRPVNGTLVPYRKLLLGEAGKLPITAIRIGPNHPHPQQAKASLDTFLRSKGLDRIQVDISPIPVNI
jgi:hypothetical protein